MPDYYGVIGVARDASMEEIERACDRALAHLEKSGQFEPYQSQLRKVRETLLNPDLRQEYDKKLRSRPLPAATASSKPAPSATSPLAAKGGARKPVIYGGVAILALCAAYLLWHFVLGVPAPPATGRYLLPLNGGSPVAVVIAHDKNHLFEGKSSPSPAVLVFKLSDKRASWLGDSVVGLIYKTGEPAPQDVMDAALKATDQNKP